MFPFSDRIAKELGFPAGSVVGATRLFEEGNTIPFIARYRKEATGGLDEVALSRIKERLDEYKELAERKETILSTIEKAGRLTDELKTRIENCFDKYELEDIYLPFKPKRRTRAQVARELGLEPLADRIFAQADDTGDIMEIAQVYGRAVSIDSPEEALKGALDIIAEKICETPEIRRLVRDLTWREGIIDTRLVVDPKESSGKYEQFDRMREPVRDIPSHRILAILRGSREKELSFRVFVDTHEVYALIDDEVIKNSNSIWRRSLLETLRDAYERLLAPQIETEIRTELKRKADDVAVDVFAKNLSDLLLAPPLRGRKVLALDPGFRTGAKLALLDETGKLLSHDVVYPAEPKRDIEGTFSVLDKLREQYGFNAVAIGNGTGGKETLKVVRRFLRDRKLSDIPTLIVNESGASIYSASDIAREEFPDLDLTVRGAVSIGRRLQDPLAELVKIDPKSIGVGQYQHDVDQKLLARKLDDVVEFCVNAVGVDLNTASVPLLSRVAGLNSKSAKSLVYYREQNGPFPCREAVLKVPYFGGKSFEQAAGFLRVVGEEPLDNSSVHPERYELVRQIATDLGCEVRELIGNEIALKKIEKNRYLSDAVGNFTLDDILKELAKPNRDPRADFTVPEYRDEINAIEDLELGMELEGVVTNAAKFGVFVDVGVHQDGMIHVSELDHRFVEDPSQIVKVGERVKVKVIEVDIERKRISLSRKALLEAPKPAPQAPRREHSERFERTDQRPPRQESRESGGRNERRGDRKDKFDPKDKKSKDVIGSGRMAEALMAALKKNDGKG